MDKEIVPIIIAIVGIIVVTSLITILILAAYRMLFPTPKVLNGSTNPTTQGSDGDFYINSTTHTLFGPKGSVTSDVWPSSGISLIGPDGVAGKTVLNGTVDPTTEGVDGDFYLNTTTSELFGPKGSVTPDVWPTPGISLIGPAGDPGTRGSKITTEDLDPTGSNPTDNGTPLAGDLHIDTTGTGYVLYKYSGTAWVSQGNLVDNLASLPKVWYNHQNSVIPNSAFPDGINSHVRPTVNYDTADNRVYTGEIFNGSSYVQIEPSLPVSGNGLYPEFKILQAGLYKVEISYNVYYDDTPDPSNSQIYTFVVLRNLGTSPASIPSTTSIPAVDILSSSRNYVLTIPRFHNKQTVIMSLGVNEVVTLYASPNIATDLKFSDINTEITYMG